MLGRSCPQLLGTFTLIATASCFCLSRSRPRHLHLLPLWDQDLDRIGARVRDHKRERGELRGLSVLSALLALGCLDCSSSWCVSVVEAFLPGRVSVVVLTCPSLPILTVVWEALVPCFSARVQRYFPPHTGYQP